MAALARAGSLLAFDLDGTLAPLVERPEDAQVPRRTAAQMRRLVGLWPVAVITGRQVDDAQSRLGFAPQYLFGNHGAEPLGMAPPSHRSERLDACRALLKVQSVALGGLGIELEDKGLSLALHYRRSADAPDAARWLDGLFAAHRHGLRLEHGHSVLNICPLDAPDKGDALLQILAHAGAARAFFIGDDANDESAFVKAPAGSVCVRIAPPHTPSRAGFRMDSQMQVDALLCLLIDMRH